MLRKHLFPSLLTLGKQINNKQQQSLSTLRKSFGSFHSDDIEEIIRQSEESFQVPNEYQEIFYKTNLFVEINYKNWEFGNSLKETLFPVSKSWTFLNHGAFGNTLLPTLHETQAIRLLCEQQPLRFYDRHLFTMICYTLRQIAKHIQCQPTELLPLPNVTTGLNAIFQSIPLTNKDEICYFNVTYGSTKKMMLDLSKRTHCKLTVINISLPIQSEEQMLQEIISQVTSRMKIIVIDQITSNTAMILPIRQIASLCKQINPQVHVIVDGAHALYSQQLSFDSTHSMNSTLSPAPLTRFPVEYVDYWLSNGHKWLGGGKGCAVMWVSPRITHIRPAIISHGFTPNYTNDNNAITVSTGKMLSAFSWDGCRDYASFISMGHTFEIWNQFTQLHKPNHLPEPLSQSQLPSQTQSWDIYRQYIQQTLEDIEVMLREIWQLQDEDFLCDITMRSSSPMRLVTNINMIY